MSPDTRPSAAPAPAPSAAPAPAAASSLATAARRLQSPTEERNPRTRDIDVVPTLTLLERLNNEDALVAAAARRALPQLAELVDVAADRFRDGGRVHYFGSGTSGRLAFLDAAELIPTFGLDGDTVVAHLAGGEQAMLRPVENAEDNLASGASDASTVTAADVVIGLSASGATPYVGAALERSRQVGAFTALLTSNPAAPLRSLADVFVCADTGPEAITGSTRLKAGTAEKVLLNAFSTALMVRSGRTFSNLMVYMMPVNAKLRGRQVHMIRQATGRADDECSRALDAAGGDAGVAIVTLLSGASIAESRTALAAAGGIVRDALARTGSAAG